MVSGDEIPMENYLMSEEKSLTKRDLVCNASEDEVYNTIKHNLQFYPAIQRIYTENRLRDAVRQRNKYRCDLAFILSTSKKSVRKILNECFKLLQSCKKFKRRIKQQDMNQILSGFLTELEFAALLKQNNYQIEFEPKNLVTGRRCEFKAINKNIGEIYFEVYSPSIIEKYDEHQSAFHELLNQLRCFDSPYHFSIRIRQYFDEDESKKITEFIKNQLTTLGSDKISHFPFEFYYPSETEPRIIINIHALAKNNKGHFMYTIPPFLPNTTKLYGKIKTAFEKFETQLPKGFFSIGVLDFSVTSALINGDVLTIIDYFMNTSNPELKKINAIFLYYREVGEKSNHNVLIIENPNARKPLPNDFLRIFTNQGYYNYNFSLF